MVKDIWPCDELEIKKGGWKITKCSHDDIKENAKRIHLEVFGQCLHNADCPLYFAKMLYVQFVQGCNVDFGSKKMNVLAHNIREDIVTFIRDDLALGLQGVDLELKKS